MPQQRSAATEQPKTSNTTSDNGFYFTGGLSRQYAQWRFDMNDAGSSLDYNDVAWNVLDITGGYRFGNIVLDGGISFGMQSGETTMTDDDITNGGLATAYTDSGTGDTVVAHQKLLSIGKSSGGSLFGLNFGIGWANQLALGKVKFTPSVGYRMFNYKLTTEKNYGLSVSSIWCDNLDGEQIVCPAYTIVNNSYILNVPDNDYATDGYYIWDLPGGSTNVSTDSMSFSQSGKTHEYNVSWDGPYLAMDIESELNSNNFVDARFELGFPGYNSKGDQPYRADWAHPTSVEDSADIFGATHLGLLANWTTMFNNNWGMTFGVTYDYYSVTGADATTNLNSSYYNAILDLVSDAGGCTDRENCTLWSGSDIYGNGLPTGTDPSAAQQTAIQIANIYSSCGDSWSCTAKNEVDSFYRSIGVRIGVTGKF